MPAKGDGVEREREEVVVVDGVGAKFGGEGGGGVGNVVSCGFVSVYNSPLSQGLS